MYNPLIIFLRKRTTIKFRIYIFSGTMIVLFLLSSIISFSIYLNDAKEERRRIIDFSINEMLSRTASFSLRRGSKDHVDSVIEALFQYPEIQQVSIYP